jgi:hypothetical protein
MDLIDRYLSAVHANLPRTQADDITAEIGDGLHTEVEEREVDLGRLLTADEIVAVLRAHGHPRLVAARYARQQALVGPLLLPFYWRTLRIALSVIPALIVGIGFIGAIGRNDANLFFAGLGAAWDAALCTFAGVTIVFALLERYGPDAVTSERIAQWDPRSLPREATRATPMPYICAGVDAVANGIAAVVLLQLGVLRGGIPVLALPAIGTWPVQPTLAWQPLYVAVLISSIVLTLAGLLAFASPALLKLRDVEGVAASLLIIVGAAITLGSGPLFAGNAGPLEAICRQCIVGGIVVLVVVAIKHGRDWLRRERAAATPMAPEVST